ncbi:MAG: DUF4239 domain-containing protein [Hydrogenophaga sp.]|nr:DUF4239 domain-containing protein [Hydrogenophaga sp.]
MEAARLAVYDHYAYAAVALVGTALAAWAIWRLLVAPRWRARVLTLSGVVPPFLNILGVLFGLTLAFIANDTWSAHDRATNAVYREADALRTLDALARSLPEAPQAALRQAVREHAAATAAEWQQLARRSSSPQAQQSADRLLSLVADPAMAQTAGNGVHSLMLATVAHLRDDRDQRIALSQMHVNPFKWMGMAFLGLLTMLSIAVVHVEHQRAAATALILFAVAAAPTAAIVLMQGNPFQSPSFVSPAPIFQLAQTPGATAP